MSCGCGCGCGLQLLETMSYKSKPEDYTLGSQPDNKDKNRDAGILPGKFITSSIAHISANNVIYW